MGAPTRINLRDIDPDLHGHFKAECARRGRSMKGVLVAFMRDATNPNKLARVCNVSKLSREYSQPR